MASSSPPDTPHQEDADADVNVDAQEETEQQVSRTSATMMGSSRSSGTIARSTSFDPQRHAAAAAAMHRARRGATATATGGTLSISSGHGSSPSLTSSQARGTTMSSSTRSTKRSGSDPLSLSLGSSHRHRKAVIQASPHHAGGGGSGGGGTGDHHRTSGTHQPVSSKRATSSPFVRHGVVRRTSDDSFMMHETETMMGIDLVTRSERGTGGRDRHQKRHQPMLGSFRGKNKTRSFDHTTAPPLRSRTGAKSSKPLMSESDDDDDADQQQQHRHHMVDESVRTESGETGGGGFSPNTLLDRYTAEIDQTTRQKEEAAEAAKHSTVAPAPLTSLMAKPSLFWMTSGDTQRDSATGIGLQSSPSQQQHHQVTRSSSGGAATAGLGGGGGGADFDIGDDFGRPSHMRRKHSPTNVGGGVFSRKEHFEHVDQSVNLMDLKGGMSMDDSESDALAHRETRRKKFVTAHSTGRFGGSNMGDTDNNNTSSQRGALPTASPKRTRSTLRTISSNFTEVFLGARSRMDLDMMDGNKIAEGDKEDEEENEGIHLISYCICLLPVILLLVAVLLMIKVLGGGGGGITAEAKAGEGMDASPLSSLTAATTKSPKRLNSPAPMQASTPTLTPKAASGPKKSAEEQWAEFQSIITANRLTSHEDLDDPNSNAHKALQWLSEESPTPLSERVVDSGTDTAAAIEKAVVERYSLAVLYFSTQASRRNHTIVMERMDKQDKALLAALESNPELLAKDKSLQWAFEYGVTGRKPGGWHHNSGWMSKSHICQWYGVQCHRDGSVSSIHLPQNRLQGQIPSELRALEQIQHLDLSYNHLCQQIPDGLWNAWKRLVTLDLSNNRLVGSLPSDMGGLVKLQNLTVANNMITGEVPSSIADMTSLYAFSAQNNKMTGPIRDTSSIPNLRILRLGQNRLEGGFPFHLTRNRNLIELRLNENQLKGTLPPELDSLHQLQLLQVDSNGFQGPIPDIFKRLHHLKVLEMQNNLLGQYHDQEDKPATLPKSLGALTNLRVLRLSTNRFHGSIPSEWWNMTNLEIFHLYDNDLEGRIPSSISSMSLLRDFQVQDTFMSSTIPPQLGECQHLETLTLYNSKFTGSVPDEVCDLRLFPDHTSVSSSSATQNTSNLSQSSKLKLLAADCMSEVQCTCCDRCY